jgi:hypothetical protein
MNNNLANVAYMGSSNYSSWPVVTNASQIADCCTLGIAGGASICSQFLGTKCICSDLGVAREVSCAVPTLYTPSTCTATIPPAGALEPVPQTASENICDYNYCYTFANGTWTAATRITYTFGAVKKTISLTKPLDPPTPYYTYNYCDECICYGRTEGGFWYSMARYGSEMTSQQQNSQTQFYGLNHVFTLLSSTWNATAIDPRFH